MVTHKLKREHKKIYSILYPFLKKGISQNECNKLVINIIDIALKAEREGD